MNVFSDEAYMQSWRRKSRKQRDKLSRLIEDGRERFSIGGWYFTRKSENSYRCSTNARCGTTTIRVGFLWFHWNVDVPNSLERVDFAAPQFGAPDGWTYKHNMWDGWDLVQESCEVTS
jgi:hypothetical protein